MRDLIIKEPLKERDAFSLLDDVIAVTKTNKYQRGALVDMRGRLDRMKDIVIVGDLHARIDNLEKILKKSNILDQLRDGRAFLVLLGDAVHCEMRTSMIGEETLERLFDMTSSVCMIQTVMKLKVLYPDAFHYLLGNHDYLSERFVKCGVMQGAMFRDALQQLYGSEYVDRYNEWLAAGPLCCVGSGIVANHAGPCDPVFTLDNLMKQDIAAEETYSLVEQLLWRRWKFPDRRLYYDEKQVRAFLSIVIGQPDAVYVVGHSPRLLYYDEYRIAPFAACLMENHYLLHGAFDETGFARFRNGGSPRDISFVSVNG